MSRLRFIQIFCASLLLVGMLSGCGVQTVSLQIGDSGGSAAAVLASPTLAPTAKPTAKPTPTPTVSPTPKPTATSKPTVKPTQMASATPKPTAKPTQAPSSATPLRTPQPQTGKPLSGLVIGIDAGHQTKANTGTEPVAPGSATMKMKVTGGTAGRFTHVAEYEVNLQVSLRLQKLLEKAGATVVMTRTKNDVNITNIERAKIFNKAKVDFGIRIHCNGSDDASVHGAFILIPSKNPYLADVKSAAKSVLSAFLSATGAKDLGIISRSDQTGFNWCTQPVFCIEMGHMTNKEEDEKLASAAYQDKMAQGIYNGILAYYEKK